MSNSSKDTGIKQVNRSWMLFAGVVLTLLGLIGFFMQVAVTYLTIYYMGFLLLIGAGIQLFDAFKAKGWKSKIWYLMLTLIYIVLGAVIVQNPTMSAVWITFFIAMSFAGFGLLRIIIGFESKNEVSKWWVIVASGIIAVLLGAIIMIQWPVSGLWVIGLFVSIELVLQGISLISIASAIKQQN